MAQTRSRLKGIDLLTLLTPLDALPKLGRCSSKQIARPQISRRSPGIGHNPTMRALYQRLIVTMQRPGKVSAAIYKYPSPQPQPWLIRTPAG